ncbi:MAG: hypothetical protein ACREVJ_06595, partial [Gammaproteobacteria bacterium]
DRSVVYSPRDLGAFPLGVAAMRTEAYESYAGRSTRLDNIDPDRAGEAFGDLGGTAELAEVADFLALRKGDPSLASRYFDYSADRYYMQGLWRAGARTEWASENVEELQAAANAASLVIRVPEDFFARF